MTEDHRTPGQLIAALLAEKNWTNRILAVVLGVGDSVVSRIVRDKTPIDAKTALALEEVFDIPAEQFLSLQSSYDLALARIEQRPDPGRAARAAIYGSLPIAEMKKRGWIDPNDLRDAQDVEAELCRFFKVNRIEDAVAFAYAAKKTEVGGAPTPSQMAWFYRVKSIAAEMLVAPYSAAKGKAAIEKIRPLRSHPEHMSRVPRILAEAGIRFVVVESLPKAKIDGVCFWLDDRSPVIGMTLRFDRIDNFLFVLRHELEHVIRGDGRQQAKLDLDLHERRDGDAIEEEERIADAAAQEFCVPDKMMRAFIARKAPYFSERDLLAFSKMVKVHPGVVAGQLQRRTGDYRRFRGHLAKVRDILVPCAEVDGWGDIHPIEP